MTRSVTSAAIRMHRILMTAAAAMLVAALGCSDSNMGSLTGTVTIDGAPAPKGAITFVPVDGKASTAGGEIIDGKYNVQLEVATYDVQIRVPKVVGQQKLYNTPDSPVQDVLQESLPPRYNDATELRVTVASGKNEPIDFPLDTKPKKK